MDPFTQRMLERARARQEKIDQKLVNSGQSVPKRKPLAESNIKSESPTKSSAKTFRTSVSSPKKPLAESFKSNTPSKSSNRRSSVQKNELNVGSPQRVRNDVVVTKKEFKSPKRGSLNRRNSDVSVEINISHRNDIQIEVQVEERDAPISVTCNPEAGSVVITEIEGKKPDEQDSNMDKLEEHRLEKGGLRHNVKSRLDRLGILYSDNAQLSSPIHRTEQEFSADTPPTVTSVHEDTPRVGKKKFGRLAALADQINNWEDDLTHHQFANEPAKKIITKPDFTKDKMESSTLDVSIHSLNDINKALSTTKAKQIAKQINTHTFIKPNECQRLEKQIVAELASIGYGNYLPSDGPYACLPPTWYKKNIDK